MGLALVSCVKQGGTGNVVPLASLCPNAFPESLIEEAFYRFCTTPAEYTFLEQKDLRQNEMRQKLFLSEMRQNPLGRKATKFLFYQIIEPDFQQNK